MRGGINKPGHSLAGSRMRLLYWGWTEKPVSNVDKVRMFYDRSGNTLTIWFDDPKKEAICEEVDDDVVLIKDRRGRVIGFERLNYLPRKRHGDSDNVPVEAQLL